MVSHLKVDCYKIKSWFIRLFDTVCVKSKKDDESKRTVNIGINYPHRFQVRYGYGRPVAKHIDSLYKSKEADQLYFLATMLQYKENLSKIHIDSDDNSLNARWNQSWFPPLDGMSMYAMVASKKPKIYLEIGSGNSTKFAYQAIKDHSLDTVVISIDPRPRAEIDKICDRVIRKPLEETSELEDIIKVLQENDVLFIDGSHRCLQNSDVTAFFIDYLPSVPDGVVVGVHDIFWPNDYPESWVTRYYNEQYILGAYMLGLGSNFRLIFSSAYMSMRFGERVCDCLEPELVSGLQRIGKGVGGGALWFSKTEV